VKTELSIFAPVVHLICLQYPTYLSRGMQKEVLDITALCYSLKFGYTDTESFSTAYSHSLQHDIAQLSIVMQ
jgi:hypothetical protein